MSTLSSKSAAVPLIRPHRAATRGPQSDSWLIRLTGRLLLAAERSRQREALRALADNKHLLDDIALTRAQALEEADTPFWR